MAPFRARGTQTPASTASAEVSAANAAGSRERRSRRRSTPTCSTASVSWPRAASRAATRSACDRGTTAAALTPASFAHNASQAAAAVALRSLIDACARFASRYGPFSSASARFASAFVSNSANAKRMCTSTSVTLHPFAAKNSTSAFAGTVGLARNRLRGAAALESACA